MAGNVGAIMTQSFSLIDQAWIPVQYDNDAVREVSLATIFEDAPRIKNLLGEMPTGAMATLRVLLAIVARSQAHHGGMTMQRWRELWRSPSTLAADVRAYLEEYCERFDLLDPNYPFMQAPGLRAASGEVVSVARMVMDTPENRPHFAMRYGEGRDRLSFAEAARWLIHAQAFDPDGIKTGAVGDSRVKMGKGYPIGNGWLGQIGPTAILGANLFETLMLNSVPVDRYECAGLRAVDVAEDLPCWERESQTAAQRGGGEFDPQPTGPIDLLTWQARRIRLHHDDHDVTGIVLANGDRIRPHNRMDVEAMTPWRYSVPQSTKMREDIFMSRLHQGRLPLWRTLASMIVPETGQVKARGGRIVPQFLRPGIIGWVGHLADTGELGSVETVQIWVSGIEYGERPANIDYEIDDRVIVPVALLGERGEEYAGALETAQDATERVIRVVVDLAANLMRASGAHLTTSQWEAFRLQEAEVFGELLSRRYLAWVAKLSKRWTPDALAYWGEQMIEAAELRANELEQSVSRHAVKGDGEMDFGTAMREFDRDLGAATAVLFR